MPTRHRRLHLSLAPMVKICFEGNDAYDVLDSHSDFTEYCSLLVCYVVLTGPT